MTYHNNGELVETIQLTILLET